MSTTRPRAQAHDIFILCCATATTTKDIGDNKQQVLDNEALCVSAQHFHLTSHNGNNDINYGNEVDEVDNKALYIEPRDSNDVNNYGGKVDKVNDKASYITSPDG
jgi:hypothetical protein